MAPKEALERLKQPFSATPDTDSYFDAKEVAIKSLEKDLSIIDELEKIKAEIEKTYPMNGYGIPSSRATGKSVGYGIHIALEIIDKHISELKGDKCDNDHDCEHCDWVECPN